MASNNKRRKRKKPITISTAEAMSRLRRMLVLIEKDAIQAVRIEAALEAGNDRVAALKVKSVPGVDAYNTIRRSLAMDLAMHLARLFDQGHRTRHANKKDTASIPMMARLLGQARCQNKLKEDARHWTGGITTGRAWERDCSLGIEGSLAAYKKLKDDPVGRSAIRLLKLVRDNHLAHSLTKDADFDVTYGQLSRLAECVWDFVDHAKLAVDGLSPAMKSRRKHFRASAEKFWERALPEASDKNRITKGDEVDSL